jgi:hypothetical protein
MTLTLCGCEPTEADLDGYTTRCSRDGVSEHVLTTRGLTVTSSTFNSCSGNGTASRGTSPGACSTT